ncbi:MAG TPA: hypothetical protein VHY19_11860 [Steroidobacteraceae bacterium]|jgi:protocatechuate 4,5-dioxygenase alpha chain|nr:hypothetical protein [Steroidobacteraceae bacterium]
MFDGELAQKGYALNRMCFSLNSAENRAALRCDEDGYCNRFGLSGPQRDAVRRRDVRAMLAAGGNIYYLVKLCGAIGMRQDTGTGESAKSTDEFYANVLAAGAH